MCSTVEDGATSVGIHFTDTREDDTLELGDVFPLGKVFNVCSNCIVDYFCLLKFCYQ